MVCKLRHTQSNGPVTQSRLSQASQPLVTAERLERVVCVIRSETGTNSGSVGRPGSERSAHESMYGAGVPVLRGSTSGSFAKQVTNHIFSLVPRVAAFSHVTRSARSSLRALDH